MIYDVLIYVLRIIMCISSPIIPKNLDMQHFRLHLQVPTWRTSGSMAWTTRWRSATNREAVMAGKSYEVLYEKVVISWVLHGKSPNSADFFLNCKISSISIFLGFTTLLFANEPEWMIPILKRHPRTYDLPLPCFLLEGNYCKHQKLGRFQPTRKHANMEYVDQNYGKKHSKTANMMGHFKVGPDWNCWDTKKNP